MATEAQTKANKDNAQFSTGPTSEEGKNTTLCNAYKHGAYATVAMRPGEPLDKWTFFRGDYVHAKSPVGLPQILCVEQAALAEFKLMYLPDFETFVRKESPGIYLDWDEYGQIAGKQAHLLRCEMHLIRVRDKHLAQLRLLKKDVADEANETNKPMTSCQLGSVEAAIPVAVQPDPEETSPGGVPAAETASDSPEELALRRAIREESDKFYAEMAGKGWSEDELCAKFLIHLQVIGLSDDSPQTQVN